jgi:hypothetical protein
MRGARQRNAGGSRAVIGQRRAPLTVTPRPPRQTSDARCCRRRPGVDTVVKWDWEGVEGMGKESERA